MQDTVRRDDPFGRKATEEGRVAGLRAQAACRETTSLGGQVVHPMCQEPLVLTVPRTLVVQRTGRLVGVPTLEAHECLAPVAGLNMAVAEGSAALCALCLRFPRTSLDRAFHSNDAIWPPSGSPLVSEFLTTRQES
jgi:hypothetical protein